MTRFNPVKTSFFDANSEINREQIRSIPTETKARVNYIYKSSDPKDKNLFFIKASIISNKDQNKITIEPTVKGSGNQVPEAELLLNNLTNITLIPQSEGLPQPSPGDEISVELVVSEVTKNLNIDGYYKRIITKNEGPSTDSINDNTQNLKDSFQNSNDLTQQDVQIPPIDPDQPDLNIQVLSIANSYSGYKYKRVGSGNPISALIHKENVILDKDIYVYCSAFTFYVAFTVLQQGGYIEEKTVREMRKFKNDWYGLGGERRRLSGPAITNLGVGVEVSWDDAKSGDFAQLWRSHGGHSVIFLDWLYNENSEKIGIIYRGSQNATGIANTTEYLKGHQKKGYPPIQELYFSRLSPQQIDK